MSTYNWQQSDWPHFRYDLTHLEARIFSIAEKAGFICGKLDHLAKAEQTEALINVMVEEAIKTSEIEGEQINREEVRSSLKKVLGIHDANKVRDKRAIGLAELFYSARKTYADELTDNMLFEWHLMLFGHSTNRHMVIGTWRTDDEPMEIISGSYGRQVVHFVAPPASEMQIEMQRFLTWFNETAPKQKKAIAFVPVRAALAHLYFESIHPFDDGNGRIGRIIAEKALSQGFGYPVLLSLSQAIEADKKKYYSALHQASRSNEVTLWIEYFIEVIAQAQNNIEKQINYIIKKSQFFSFYKNKLNERQWTVVKRMLQEGMKGFEGGMSAKKYMLIAKTSKATATRDLQELVELGVFQSLGAGRNIHYELNLSL